MQWNDSLAHKGVLEFSSSLITALRIGRERRLDRMHEARGEIWADIAQARASPLVVPALDFDAVCPGHGVGTAHEVIEEHAETVDVGGARGNLPTKYLGREIQRGAGNIGQPGFGRHTCAEIHQHDATTALTHDVPCLDIAVHEPGIVHGGQRATEVETDQLCLLRTERAARAQFCIQVRPRISSIHRPRRPSNRSAP